MNEEYEWGVGTIAEPGAHRTGWTEKEAREWISEAEEDGFPADFFFAIRRPVGEWVKA
ncbi:MAG: hypothetical protein IPG94_22465 [Kineosporiaceae bacterium]|nr:hypothetical protein [Kineosporiaceae bacterium]